MSIEWIETEFCKVACCDCREALAEVQADAVVTDPPYGIGKRLTRGGDGGGWHRMIASGAEQWDIRPPKELFDQLLSIGSNQIIWGGNFLPLPPCEKPLCWDKVRPNQKNVSEWEYAWTSLVGRAELFRFCANGGFLLDAPRDHPTQKPISLMVWCLGFLREANTVFDPFMGSGTTAVACIRTGRKFIGCEIDRKYFDIALKRIREAEGEGSLFPPAQAAGPALLFDED